MSNQEKNIKSPTSSRTSSSEAENPTMDHSRTGASTPAHDYRISLFGEEAIEKREPIVTISKPIGEVYAFLKNLSNLQHFMTGVRSISPVSDKIYHWIAEGLMESSTSQKNEWNTEVISDLPEKLIAWKTTGGNETFKQIGAITLEPATGNRGTRVTLKVAYTTPVGKAAGSLSMLIGKDPQTQAWLNLRRLKAFMETGEIPTVEGQPNGNQKSDKH